MVDAITRKKMLTEFGIFLGKIFFSKNSNFHFGLRNSGKFFFLVWIPIEK